MPFVLESQQIHYENIMGCLLPSAVHEYTEGLLIEHGNVNNSHSKMQSNTIHTRGMIKKMSGTVID